MVAIQNSTSDVASRLSRSRRSSSLLHRVEHRRASSCDTRSRIAPHSTSIVPVDRFDRHVPAIARDALRPILEAGRLPRRRSARGAATRTPRSATPLISTRTATIRSLSIERSP